MSVAVSRPEATSHNFTVLSQLAEAMRLPSGLNATKSTCFVCPVSVAVWRPEATIPQFHRRVKAGRGDPRAIRTECNTPDTIHLCPVSVRAWRPEAGSHNFTVLS